jgi:hypothetical protein
MISKIVLQVSETKPEQHVIEMINTRCVGWEYKHFNDEEILEFYKNNPIEDFPQDTELFNEIVKSSLRYIFFNFYFLYVNGGFYINDSIIFNTNIEDVIKNYKFVSVSSCVQKKSLFLGILGASPKNPILRGALNFFYNLSVQGLKELTEKSYIVGEIVYNLTLDNMYDDITQVDENSLDVKLYNEDKDESTFFANIYNDKTPREKLFTHHFYTKKIPKIVSKPSSAIETKIGISFSFPKDSMSIFSNGIRQNVIFLYDLLTIIGYDVYFLIDSNEMTNSTDYSFWNKKDKYKYLSINEVLNKDFHIVMQMGREIEMSILEFLQICGTKTIYYCCGNKYLIESEQCLFKSIDNEHAYFQYNNSTFFKFTQVWLIPQMVNSCKHYLQTFFRSTVIDVPFIWAPSILNEYEKELGVSCSYKNRGASKKVAIFEPNLSLMKWCLPSILVCENTHRQLVNKSLLDFVFITNISSVIDSSKDLFSKKILNGLIKSLDLFKTKKLSIESRYNSLFFMSKYSDIAVSHQMENNLNYLYLDLAWMGWPVVHNANLCKDVGYYYEGFNYEEGGDMLKYVILNHDENVEKYKKHNREVIDRYLPTNKFLQEQYKQLVDNILEL